MEDADADEIFGDTNLTDMLNRSGGVLNNFTDDFIAMATNTKEPEICEKDGKGTVFPLFSNEHEWNSGARAVLYCLAMFYLFLGVNVAADRFVAAIESITSRKKRIRLKTTGRLVTVLVWNSTVANLTLMALGSSAPEILLSAIEIVAENFEAGELGPGTIVGSAAFNLFVIIAVCVVAIPSPEIRQIKETNVFFVTAAFSLFAYAWLVLIVEGPWSQNEVDLWEAVLTLLWCPVLVLISYGADVGWFTGGSRPKVKQHCLAADYGTGSWSAPARADLQELHDPNQRFSVHGHPYQPQHNHQLLQQQQQQQVLAPYQSPHWQSPPPGMAGGGAGGGDLRDVEGKANGVLAFEFDAVEVTSSSIAQTFMARVCRRGGTRGEVSCKYRMERLSAVPGYDYVEEEGTLEFGDGDVEALVPVTILPKHLGENKDTFQIILEDPEGGVVFDPADDGGTDSGVLTITILNHHETIMQSSCCLKLSSKVDRRINLDEIRLGTATWWNELKDAFLKVVDEEDDKPTALDYVWHILILPWKFSVTLLVPPPVYCGGWVCFVTALAVIGGQTLLIMDFANLFGCVANIDDQITAITIVALGTSMPDLFASRTAAMEDKWADASIVNVTGSNSVNVFMGIGLPWTMAAIYHKAKGTTFKVIGGDLSFSVIAFTLAAFIALGLIRLRRVKLGGELGGPFALKILSGIVLVLLWVFYIVVSIWKNSIGDAPMGEQAMILFQCLFALENIIVVCAIAVYFITKNQKGETKGLKSGVDPERGSDADSEAQGPPSSMDASSASQAQKQPMQAYHHPQYPQQPLRILGQHQQQPPYQQPQQMQQQPFILPSLEPAPSNPAVLPGAFPPRRGVPPPPGPPGMAVAANHGKQNPKDGPSQALQPFVYGRPARRSISFASVALASMAVARMRRGQRKRERQQWIRWMQQREEAEGIWPQQQPQPQQQHHSTSFSGIAVPVLAAVRLRRRALRTRRHSGRANEDEEAFLSPPASFRSFGEPPPSAMEAAGGTPGSAGEEGVSSRVGNFIVNHAQDWAALGVAGYMATRLV